MAQYKHNPMADDTYNCMACLEILTDPSYGQGIQEEIRAFAKADREHFSSPEMALLGGLP